MPTIEKFAAALQDQGWKPIWTPIVAIQSHGSRPPFFCVHGGFGGVLFYGQLARCLGTEQPLYGLQAEGLDNGPIEHTSIQSMAEYYIEENGGVQPHGPYSLGGYSFGGIVAFEMAQQLRAQGEEVALVVLFDALDPRKWARRLSLTEWIRSWLQIKELLSRVRLFKDLLQRAGRKIGAILAKGQMDVRNLLDKAKKLNPGSSSTQEHALRVVQLANRRALSAYELHPYPGRVTLFRAEGPDNASPFGAESGWTEFAKGGIQIHQIPGEHQKIFAQPNVRTLAEKLDACLRSSQFPVPSSLFMVGGFAMTK
jgi:thioesterase domain-containing protein